MTAVGVRTVSGRIAEFVRDLAPDDVPETVRERAKLHLLDALGIAIASSGMDFGSSVHRAGMRLGGGGESHAIGFGTALPAPSAALVNGTLIHGLDFDDTHIEAIHHASAPALAAALATAEAEHADGASTLLAYIVGLEVGCRLAAAGSGEFHDRGLHPTGILGTFAAACVTGKLRRVSARTLVSALGLCGSQAAGILEIRRSWLKRFHPGWAAHAGIIASTLAEEGFVGPDTVFEGPQGLYASHLGTTPDSAALGLDDLGRRWMTSEIALKPYPCCHFTHAFVDAGLALRAQGVRPEDIERIECPVTTRLMPVVTEPATHKTAPPTIYDALFSVQYAVALALTKGRVDLSTFYDDPLDDPEVLAVAARVVCPPDPASDYPRHFPGEVILHLRDGRTLRRRVPASRGTHEQPLSASEVSGKFHANAGREMPTAQAQAVADAANRIEHLSDIGELVKTCATERQIRSSTGTASGGS
jgi:2-methylcitrate dehydratase PrpD